MVVDPQEKHEVFISFKGEEDTRKNSTSHLRAALTRTEHEIMDEISKNVLEKLDGVYVRDLDIQTEKLEHVAHLQEEICEQTQSLENKENHEATLQRIKRHKMEKKWRKLRLTPELLSHMEISSSATNNYF